MYAVGVYSISQFASVVNRLSMKKNKKYILSIVSAINIDYQLKIYDRQFSTNETKKKYSSAIVGGEIIFFWEFIVMIITTIG